MKYLSFVGPHRRKILFSISEITSVKKDPYISGNIIAKFKRDIVTNDEEAKGLGDEEISVDAEEVFDTLSEAMKNVVKKVFSI